jgi:PTH1 family peptidyl-tRNA hydrolase
VYKFKGRTFSFKAKHMNLSGKAVQYWMDKENIPLENILAITDDLICLLERFASNQRK